MGESRFALFTALFTASLKIIGTLHNLPSRQLLGARHFGLLNIVTTTTTIIGLERSPVLLWLSDLQMPSRARSFLRDPACLALPLPPLLGGPEPHQAFRANIVVVSIQVCDIHVQWTI